MSSAPSIAPSPHTSWKCDGNQLSWEGEIEGLGMIHAWILPRRPYCDRGHWNWGMTYENGALMEPEVSYYFLSEQTARCEIEELLIRSSTGQARSTEIAPVAECNKKKWAQQDGQYLRMFEHDNGSVLVAIEYVPLEHGGMWEVECKGLELDHADAFPRRFFFLENAMGEVERFLNWRLHKVPFEQQLTIMEQYQEAMFVPMEETCAQLVCLTDPSLVQASDIRNKSKLG